MNVALAALAVWRRRGDTVRDALWSAAAWGATAADLTRQHPDCPRVARQLAAIQDKAIEILSQDPAAVLLVMNERIAAKERRAKTAPVSEPAAPADHGRARTRERQWLIPR